jgi:hypothetical protein
MTNDERIYHTAVTDGMPIILSTVIVAQARHETGNYTSHFFTDGNNCFGYSYYAGSKWQIAAGGTADNGAPIAQYATIENSVHELTDWIKRRQMDGKFPHDLNEINTPEKYARLLKDAGYYGATYASYAAGLVNWLSVIGSKLTTGNTAILLLIIALGLLAYRNKLFS